jgi:hypothetical protein
MFIGCESAQTEGRGQRKDTISSTEQKQSNNNSTKKKKELNSRNVNDDKNENAVVD